ncbi:hypothetical protein MKX03_028712, partial [Papaver bracteatum]
KKKKTYLLLMPFFLQSRSPEEPLIFFSSLSPSYLGQDLKVRKNKKKNSRTSSVRGSLYWSQCKSIRSLSTCVPDSRDSFSLKPGSLVSSFSSLNVSEVKKPETLTAPIAGACYATTQYSNQPQRSPTTNTIPQRDNSDSREVKMNERHVAEYDHPVQNGNLAHNVRNSQEVSDGTSCSSKIQDHSRDWNHRSQDRTVEEYRSPATIVLDRSRLPQNERYRFFRVF